MRPSQHAFTRIVSIALFGIVIGAIASLAAILFVELVGLLNHWLLISARSRMMTDNVPLLVLATITVPALGGLVVGLLCQYIPERRPHGPPDIIQVAQGQSSHMPLRSGLLTAAASLVSLGSGASVGQYGPLTHLGSTLGSAIARFTGNNTAMGTIGVGCGVAAAISTAFNAPIAGLVFAHEVILRHYSLRAFAPITVAATIGFIVANVIFDRSPLFRIDAISVDHTWEFFAFILIGVCGAFVAVVYMRAILLSNRLAVGIDIPAPLKPALAGIVMGFIAIWIPDILGIGKETLRFAIIQDAFTPMELALILMAKILATALCIGFGFAGGVFSPALLVGILFGALAGSGAELLLGELRSDIAIYAICGMAAVTSPVIGAPLTTILIVFELTRNYDLTTAVMVSVVFSNLVSYRIFGRSLFDVQMNQRGFDLSMGRDKVVLDHRPIVGYVSQEFTVVTPQTTLAQVKSALIKAEQTEAYVVADDGVYRGTITLGQLIVLEDQDIPSQQAVEQYAQRERLILTGATSIWAAMEEMGDFVGESIPVVEDREDYRLLGVVFETTIVKAYLETLYEIRREENAA